MISLRPSLITEHHSVSSLNDLAREAAPCSRDLRPARDEDTTYTVGGNCSRVDGDKCTISIEPRSYSPDASGDPTDARPELRAHKPSMLGEAPGLIGHADGGAGSPFTTYRRIGVTIRAPFAQVLPGAG